MSKQIIQFEAGDILQSHTITINDDNDCEIGQKKTFSSYISLESGIGNISVTVPQAIVTIDDTDDLECGK